MNNLIIAQNYETFGDEGLTSNKVIYYQDGELVRDLRPATLNNVSGFYDEVTQTLFTASNFEVE